MKLNQSCIWFSVVLSSTPLFAMEKLPPAAADEVRRSLRGLEAAASLEGAEFINKKYLAELVAQHLSAIEKVLDRNGITYPTPKTPEGLSLIKTALLVPTATEYKSREFERLEVGAALEFEGT